MGAYLCIASNGVPPTVSKRIMLVVHCKCFDERCAASKPLALLRRATDSRLVASRCSRLSHQLLTVSPMISIPNQLVGAQEGQQMMLECHSEAYPKSINYWTRENNVIIANGTSAPVRRPAEIALALTFTQDYMDLHATSWRELARPRAPAMLRVITERRNLSGLSKKLLLSLATESERIASRYYAAITVISICNHVNSTALIRLITALILPNVSNNCNGSSSNNGLPLPRAAHRPNLMNRTNPTSLSLPLPSPLSLSLSLSLSRSDILNGT